MMERDACDSSARFAYADPPYPGFARNFYRDHPDFGGEVDHEQLIADLSAYDGWALSTSSATLREVLALCPPGVRVGPWIKPFAGIFNRGRYPQYAWEPVIWSPIRARPDFAQIVSDWVRAMPVAWKSQPGGVPGMKPDEVSFWIFEVLGARPGDEFVDLFPGSGSVSRAWMRWQEQRPLVFPRPRRSDLTLEATG